MDDKTAELRDIFVSVADGNETLTETQEEQRKMMPDDTDELIVSIIEEMQANFEFSTSLDTDALLTIVKGVHDDVTDEELATQLETDSTTIQRARYDLHLFRDTDPAPELEDDYEHARDIVQTTNRAYDQRFEQAVTNNMDVGSDLAEMFEDGLDEAVAEPETDFSS